jgi:hypothetical protein
MSIDIKPYFKKLKQMIKEGKGSEYIKNNKIFFDKEFPIKIKIVNQIGQLPKARKLEEYISENKIPNSYRSIK